MKKTARQILDDFNINSLNEKIIIDAMEKYASQFSQTPVIDREGAIKSIKKATVLGVDSEENDVYLNDREANEVLDSLIQSGYINKGWVSIEDYLPNEHDDVLVAYNNKKGTCEWIEQTSFYKGRFESKEEITHWQPLPPPPSK